MRHLLGQGWKVRALTRNPDSKSARELRDLRAELVRGDFDDRASLKQALDGIYGVFMPSFQVNMRATPEIEIKYGIALLEAAKDAGVRHFVYISEIGADKNTDIPYLESKRQIESHIRELGLPATIVRHAFFVDWLVSSMGSTLWRGLEKGLKQNQTIQVISLDDLGAFAAFVFNDSKQFIGREIEIAGDEASLEQMSQAYRRVKGTELKSTWLPYWLLTRMGNLESSFNICPCKSLAQILRPCGRSTPTSGTLKMDCVPRNQCQLHLHLERIENHENILEYRRCIADPCRRRLVPARDQRLTRKYYVGSD